MLRLCVGAGSAGVAKGCKAGAAYRRVSGTRAGATTKAHGEESVADSRDRLAGSLVAARQPWPRPPPYPLVGLLPTHRWRWGSRRGAAKRGEGGRGASAPERPREGASRRGSQAGMPAQALGCPTGKAEGESEGRRGGGQPCG